MDKLLKVVIVLKVMLAAAMILSCAVTQERPREWSDNDWAKLSQAVGQETGR